MLRPIFFLSKSVWAVLFFRKMFLGIKPALHELESPYHGHVHFI